MSEERDRRDSCAWTAGGDGQQRADEGENAQALRAVWFVEQRIDQHDEHAEHDQHQFRQDANVVGIVGIIVALAVSEVADASDTCGSNSQVRSV